MYELDASKYPSRMGQSWKEPPTMSEVVSLLKDIQENLTTIAKMLHLGALSERAAVVTTRLY
jgi:hypothetical protein